MPSRLSGSSLISGDGLCANGSPPCQRQTAAVHLKICVSYVDYIEDTTGDNASTTQRKAHAGYIKDTRFRTGDKCRWGSLANRRQDYFQAFCGGPTDSARMRPAGSALTMLF
jgi:hypothetical protein